MIKNSFLSNYKYFIIVSSIFIFSCNPSDDEIIIDIEEPLIDIYEEDTSFKSVGYLPSYRFSLVDQINFNQVTYVNIAFGNLNASGNLVVGNGDPITTIIQKIQSTNTKLVTRFGYLSVFHVYFNQFFAGNGIGIFIFQYV